jgi:DNA-binding transcriptional MerR regulator
MKTYKTAEVAKIIGVHPNTVRLYEELELIPKPERRTNGYRVFTDFHIEQFKVARLAFQIEVLQNGLRKKIIEMVKVSATGDFDKALKLTNEYLLQVQKERHNAEDAIEIVKEILFGEPQESSLSLKRKEASDYLNISMDAIRNWEMNGLLSVKRRENGYRVYTDSDIKRLKIIRSLRCANYSLEAILRMLNELSSNPNANIKKLLNTPRKDDDIISVCDKLISSLQKAESNAKIIIIKLEDMKTKYS